MGEEGGQGGGGERDSLGKNSSGLWAPLPLGAKTGDFEALSC